MAASVYCPWTPSYSLRRDKEPKVIKAQFGDGYAQRVGIGINNAPASFSLRFDARTGAEVRDMEAFFAAMGGVTPFYLDLPGEAWTVTAGGFGVGDAARTQFQLQRTALATKPVDAWSGDSTVYTVPRTNLNIRSQTIGGTGWSLPGGGTGTAPIYTGNYAAAPDGTLTASRIQCNQGAGGTSGDFSMVQGTAATVTNGTAYVLSVWLKSNTGGDQNVYLSASGLVPTLVVATTTWQRFSITLTSTGAGLLLNLGLRGGTTAGGSTLDVLAWGAQLETGSTPTRYIPTTSAAVTVTPAYWPSTGDGFAPVLALDPAVALQIWRKDWQGTQLLYPTSRTNMALQSETLDNASWTYLRAAVAANSIAAPDGATTAEKITEDATASNTHMALSTNDIVVVNGTRYTTSIFLKAGTRTWAQLAEGQGATAGAYFNLSTGAIGTVSGTGSPTATITPLANGWYRCTLSWTAIGAAARVRLYMANADGGNTYTGDGTSYLYAWGAQVEAASAATSYIPTTTAAVSRTDYTYTASGLITLAVAPVTGAVMTFTAAGPERHQLVATKWSRGWDAAARNSLQVDVMEDFS